MTLNITAITPSFITQVSDRRMVDLNSGQLEDDEVNKALVLSCVDALLTITFAGIGKFGGQRMDRWLAEVMQDECIPEVGAEQAVTFVARAATELFGRLAVPEGCKPHTFVISGWINRDGGNERTPGLWLVSNCVAAGLSLGVAEDEFRISRYQRGVGRVGVAGLVPAFTRGERRRLQAALRAAKDADGVEAAMVQTIRNCGSKPQWSFGIGRNCMAISLSRSAEARATYYPESGNPHAYGPHFLWNSGSANISVGDIDVLPGWGYRVAFGGDPSPITLVVGQPDNPNGPPPLIDQEKLVADFSYRLTSAMSRTFGPGDEAQIVRIIR